MLTHCCFAVAIQGSDGNHSVTLERSAFAENSALQGGCISLHGAIVANFSLVGFFGNEGRDKGGAISMSTVRNPFF